MKKFIALITLVSVLSCAGCGEKAESSTSTSSSSSSAAESSASEESVAEESSEEESSVAESSENDEDYFDWWGIKMYRPANYYVMNTEGFPHASINDDDGILTNIVYYTLNDDSVEQTPEAVKDYIYSSAMRSSILAAEHKGSTIKENEIESEEKVQVNGCDFIRQAGVFHTTDYIDDVDYAYVAYFGAMDFPDQGVQPAVFIAFSHHTDDEMKAELARLVDTAAKDAVPMK